MMKQYLSLFLVILGLSWLSSATATETSISVHDAMVRAAPPNAPALAAFMLLRNPSDKEIKLLSVSATGYQRIELHRTVHEDNMMKMVKQAFIPIPAKGETLLQAGSWHMMLLKPEKVPAIGDEVALTLHFDNEENMIVKAVVKVASTKHSHHE